MSTLILNRMKSNKTAAALACLLSICFFSTTAMASPNSANKMRQIRLEISAIHTAADAERALNRLAQWSLPKGGDQALLKAGIDELKNKINGMIKTLAGDQTLERQILEAVQQELEKPSKDLASQVQLAKDFAARLRVFHTENLANAKSANTQTIYALADAMSTWAKVYCLPECKDTDLKTLRGWKDSLEAIRDGVINGTPSASVHERKFLVELTQKIGDALDSGGQTRELLGQVAEEIHSLDLLGAQADPLVKVDPKARKSPAKNSKAAQANELKAKADADDSNPDSNAKPSKGKKNKKKKKAKKAKNKRSPIDSDSDAGASNRMGDGDEAEFLSGKTSKPDQHDSEEGSHGSDSDESEHLAGKNQTKTSEITAPSDHVSAEEAERIFGKFHAALTSDAGRAPIRGMLMGTVFSSCAHFFTFAQETSSDAHHGQQCSQTKGWVITDVDGHGRKCVADIQKTTKGCDKAHPCQSISDLAGSSFTTSDDKKDFDLVLFTKDPSADQNDKGAWSCENVPNSPDTHFESPTTRALRAQEEKRQEQQKKHAEILANIQCQHSFRAIEDIARPALKQALNLKLITSTDFSETEESFSDLQFTYLLSEFEVATGTKQVEIRTQLQEFAVKNPEYKARLLESLFVSAAKQLEAGEFNTLKSTLATLSKLGLNEEERRQVKRIMSYLHAGELAQASEDGWQQNTTLRTGYINVLNELAKQVQSDCMGRHQNMESCSRTQMALSSVQQIPYAAMQRDQQKMMFAMQLQSQMGSLNMMNMNPMFSQSNFMSPFGMQGMQGMQGGFSMNPMHGGGFNLGLGGGYGNFGMNGFGGQSAFGMGMGMGMNPFAGNPWAGNQFMPGGFSPLGL